MLPRQPSLVLVTILLLAGWAGAGPNPVTFQTQPPEDGAEVLKRVARSMGRYARDVSEILLHVESTVSKFDSSGRQKRRQSSSHSMQYVTRSYAAGRTMRHLQMHKPGLHRMSGDELTADSATALLALAFDNSTAADSYGYELIHHLISERLEVKMNDVTACEGFDPNVRHQFHWCGETHLFLDAGKLDPLSASFVGGGFPRAFGKIRYLSFAFVEDFQTVSVAGSREPFLLPAKVVVTYETDQGRTVIENKYSVPLKNVSAAR